ncbi:MAG: Nif3-like dinuclear metal center hexameric protein [Armatimonadota bacterium]|nr:Nif3-like dinuclear metal center hexameric protein [Armatimonadota bacterium]
MTVADIISYLEEIAPPRLAAPDDPIGLHIGDPAAIVTRIAVSVDPSRDVIDRAISIGAEMLVCHHPLIYKPIANFTTSNETGDLALRAAKAGLAVYVAHTNYDSAPGGVNDSLAERLGIVDTELLSVVTTEPYYKVAVFVPDEALEDVRAAMCGAGGFIGKYSDCSFRTKGVGTFKPLEGAQPYIGETGKLEQAEEWRLETLAPESALPEVIEAMLQAHPYEEVAYDVYPLRNEPKKFGFGRVGKLEKRQALGDFGRHVEDVLHCPGFTRMTGDPAKTVRTVAICGGGGASLMPDAVKSGADVFVTGDVGHHHFLTAEWHGLAVIDAGHFQTEKPGMEALTERLTRKFSGEGIAAQYVDR